MILKEPTHCLSYVHEPANFNSLSKSEKVIYLLDKHTLFGNYYFFIQKSIRFNLKFDVAIRKNGNLKVQKNRLSINDIVELINDYKSKK